MWKNYSIEVKKFIVTLFCPSILSPLIVLWPGRWHVNQNLVFRERKIWQLIYWVWVLMGMTICFSLLNALFPNYLSFSKGPLGALWEKMGELNDTSFSRMKFFLESNWRFSFLLFFLLFLFYFSQLSFCPGLYCHQSEHLCFIGSLLPSC